MRYGWVVFLLMPMAWADQVCIEKGTGRLLEYQQFATPGTCSKNMASSHPGVAFEEKTVTPEEWEAIKQTWIDAPVAAQKQHEAEAVQVMLDPILQKLNLSQKEFDDLKEILR